MVPCFARKRVNINVLRYATSKQTVITAIYISHMLMSVPGLFRTERGSDWGGGHDFELNLVPLFARKSMNTIVSLSAAPKQALVPANRYYWRCKLVIQQCLYQVSLGLKEVQIGP